jgi:DNA-directed RNA polymerase beta' subunit
MAALSRAGNRPLKSLFDMPRAVDARQNLLGKRVDYPAVHIVIGPELKLHQWSAEESGARPVRAAHHSPLNPGVHTVQGKEMIEKQTPEVWDILEGDESRVLLNRARPCTVSIQASNLS